MKLPIDKKAQPAKRQWREEKGLRAFLNKGFSDDFDKNKTRDKYKDQVKNNLYREKKVLNLIQYQWALHINYPRLLRFAINQFSVLAMSNKLKQVFSITGNIVQPNRARLKTDIISTAMCLG